VAKDRLTNLRFILILAFGQQHHRLIAGSNAANGFLFLARHGRAQGEAVT